MLNIIKDIGKQIGLIFLYLILNFMLLSKSNSMLLQNNLSNYNLILYSLQLIFGYLVMLIIFLLIFHKITIPKLKDFKKNGLKYIKENIKYYLLGILIMILSNLVIINIIGESLNENLTQVLISNAFIASTLSILIFAPIIEELLTRALLKDTFKHKYIYILLSGFIFGLLHVISSLIDGNFLECLYIIPYGALGCVFAKMYLKTDNIWTNITFHFLHNLICLLLIIGG